MPFDIIIQSSAGLPPPYTVQICDPGPINCTNLVTGLPSGSFPYTIPYTTIPPQYQIQGAAFIIQLITEDPNYVGNCDPITLFNVTPSVTPTNTVTPTPTLTPSPTLPIPLSCPIFTVTNNNKNTIIWYYNFNTNVSTNLNINISGPTPDGLPLDVANTQNTVYVLTRLFTPTDFLLHSYSYTNPSLTLTYLQTITINGSASLERGLEFANGVLIAANQNNIVTINPNTGSISTLFAKPANRELFGDILYTQGLSGPKLICIYKDNVTNDFYITQHSYSSGIVEVDIKIYDSSTNTGIQDPHGLFTVSGSLYITQFVGNVYTISPNSPYIYTYVQGIGFQVLGSSNNSSCNTFEFIVVPPSPSVTPTQTVTPSSSAPFINYNISVDGLCDLTLNDQSYSPPYPVRTFPMVFPMSGAPANGYLINNNPPTIQLTSVFTYYNNYITAQYSSPITSPFYYGVINTQNPLAPAPISTCQGAINIYGYTILTFQWRPFTYTMTFTQPTNNVVITLIGGKTNVPNYPITMTLTTDIGNPNIFIQQNCHSYVSQNNIVHLNQTSEEAGGIYVISSSVPYTTLSISSNDIVSNSERVYMGICLSTNNTFYPINSPFPTPTPTPTPNPLLLDPNICTNGIFPLPYTNNGSVSINGITVKSTIIGDVIQYTGGYSATNCDPTQPTVNYGATAWLGKDSSFTYTVTFGNNGQLQVNNVVLIFAGAGIVSDIRYENFIITINNNVVPNITKLYGCNDYRINNELFMGCEGEPYSPLNAYVITNQSGTYNSITIQGNGGLMGTTLLMCVNNLSTVPITPPVPVTPTPTPTSTFPYPSLCNNGLYSLPITQNGTVVINGITVIASNTYGIYGDNYNNIIYQLCTYSVSPLNPAQDTLSSLSFGSPVTLTFQNTLVNNVIIAIIGSGRPTKLQTWTYAITTDTGLPYITKLNGCRDSVINNTIVHNTLGLGQYCVGLYAITNPTSSYGSITISLSIVGPAPIDNPFGERSAQSLIYMCVNNTSLTPLPPP